MIDSVLDVYVNKTWTNETWYQMPPGPIRYDLDILQLRSNGNIVMGCFDVQQLAHTSRAI